MEQFFENFGIAMANLIKFYDPDLIVLAGFLWLIPSDFVTKYPNYTIHNLDKDECEIALKEISRVSKKNAFITVDAFNNEDEKKRMYAYIVYSIKLVV